MAGYVELGTKDGKFVVTIYTDIAGHTQIPATDEEVAALEKAEGLFKSSRVFLWRNHGRPQPKTSTPKPFGSLASRLVQCAFCNWETAEARESSHNKEVAMLLDKLRGCPATIKELREILSWAIGNGIGCGIRLFSEHAEKQGWFKEELSISEG